MGDLATLGPMDVVLGFLQSIGWLWPEFLLLLGAVMLPILGLRVRSPTILGGYALLVLLVSGVLTLDQSGAVPIGFFGPGPMPGQEPAVLFGDPDPSHATYGGPLIVDLWSIFLRILFMTIAGLVGLAAVSRFRDDEPYQGEFFGLLLLATVGMNIVAMSGDLIALFIGFEMSSVATFAMTAFRKKSRTGIEAAIKFFLIGALSSAILIYGVSLIYGTTGTIRLHAMAEAAGDVTDRPPLFLGMVLVLVGFGFKIAAVPFHGWAPDAYTGAPHPVAPFLAAGTKKMGAAAAFKVFVVGLVALKSDWQALFGVVAIMTMTLGNLAALRQDDLKRMLAYSSIAQAGYILIAAAVATPLAIAGGLYHIMVHLFMKSGAFFVLGATEGAGAGRSIRDFQGLPQRSPFLGAAMAIFLLSLAGIPPLGGFFSKFYLFAPAVQAGGWFIALAVAGVLNSAVSLYYYARVIRVMYKLDPLPGKDGPIKIRPGLAAAIAITAVGTIVTFFLAGPLFDAAFESSCSLFETVPSAIPEASCDGT